MLMPEHDMELPFAEVDCGDGSGFEIEHGPNSMTISGDCPRCGGTTSMSFPRTGPERETKSLWPDRRGAPPKKTAVYCACGTQHPKRPADSTETGCGAYWDVKTP